MDLDLSGLAQRRAGRVDIGHGRVAAGMLWRFCQQCKHRRARNGKIPKVGTGFRKDHAQMILQPAILPPNSSSIWTRMISSNDASARKPSASARRRIEPARPAGDDAGDQRIGLAADAGGDLVAGDPAQRGDLLGHGAADARHGEIDARPELRRVEPRGMNEKAHRRARARMPMQHAVGDRQHGLFAGQAVRG